MVVEVIEADLAASDDFGFGEELVEFGVCGFVGELGFVRMDSGGGEDLWRCGAVFVLAAEVEGLMHGVGAFADADGEDGADSGGPGAVEEGFAVFGVAGAVEMGVGVYEHWLSMDSDSNDRS